MGGISFCIDLSPSPSKDKNQTFLVHGNRIGFCGTLPSRNIKTSYLSKYAKKWSVHNVGKGTQYYGGDFPDPDLYEVYFVFCEKEKLR